MSTPISSPVDLPRGSTPKTPVSPQAEKYMQERDALRKLNDRFEQLLEETRDSSHYLSREVSVETDKDIYEKQINDLLSSKLGDAKRLLSELASSSGPAQESWSISSMIWLGIFILTSIKRNKTNTLINMMDLLRRS